MRAFGHIYAGWALSQDFYRADLHRLALGAPDLETFLRTDWAERFASFPAATSMPRRWPGTTATSRTNPRYGGDLPSALRAIQARVLLLPSETDLYFRVADNEAECRHLANAQLSPIPSIWGPSRRQPERQPGGYGFHQGRRASLAVAARPRNRPGW